jgi:pentatricopeptide repeat domain-containing protein 1
MRKDLILLPLIAQTVTGFSAGVTKPNQLKPNKQSSEDLSYRLLSLSRSGKIKEAVELYYDAWNIKNVQPSTRTMNNAIGACARSFKPLYNEAFDIFQHGLDNGLQPNVYTFGSLMSVCAKKGNVQKCTSLLKKMKGYGIKPNSVIYSTAISACERCSPPKSELAIELLREGTNKGTMDGFMNIVGYNAAISVCARAGEWRQACQLLNEMEGRDIAKYPKPILDSDLFTPRPDEVTYGTVMAACERAKEWQKVLELSKLMEVERDDLTMDGMSISSALHACQNLGYGRDALIYLEKMKELGKQSNNTQSNNQRNRGNRRRKALKGPDDVAYRLTISACARGGLIHEAIDLLQEMETEMGSPPDVAAYSAAIGGCAEVGEYILAFGLLKQMKQNGVEPNVITYSAVISACAAAIANAEKKRKDSKSKDPFFDEEDSEAMVKEPMRAGLKLLEKMKKDKCEDGQPNIVTYNAAIKVCAEGLDVTKAFKLLEDLLDRGLEPTIVTYGTLMTACERVGDVAGASKVFREMRANDIKPNEIIYGAAISCCRKASQPERPLLLLRKMIEDRLSPNTATFNTVIMAQTEAGNMEKASAVFKLLTSTHAKRAKPNRQTYNIIIKAMAANSQPKNAEYYLKVMREDGMMPDVDLLTAIVSSYERAREPIKALQMMESMREAGFDFYGNKIFDVAFKQGVKVIHNVVGNGFGGENATATFSDDEM